MVGCYGCGWLFWPCLAFGLLAVAGPWIDFAVAPILEDFDGFLDGF